MAQEEAGMERRQTEGVGGFSPCARLREWGQHNADGLGNSCFSDRPS